MPIHITQISTRKFICGLFWQSLSRPRDLLREAAELGGKIDSDLLVLRNEHGNAQAGYAHTRDGARCGMYSLAAAISNRIAADAGYYDEGRQPANNWLAAFRLPDDIWVYFAVRDSNFLPNGDFAGSREEVIDRLLGDYALGGWNIVIGDAELEALGFHHFSKCSIETLLEDKKKGRIRTRRWWALRQVRPRFSPLHLIVIAGILIFLTAAGALSWSTYKQKKEQEERDRALEAARRKMLGKAIPGQMPHPWPAAPLPQPMAKACVDKLSWIAPGGWTLDEFVCSAQKVSYKWSRGSSTAGYLLAKLPQAALEINGDKAGYAESLVLPAGGDERLLDAEQALRPLQSRFQLLGMPLKIVLVPPPKPMPGTAEHDASLPDWQTYSLKASTSGMPPLEMAAMLEKPGIRIQKISYRASTWTFEGVIYAK